MPTARLIAANSSVAIQTQGYTKGKTRGATIMYGNPAATSGWLTVVTNNVGGTVAGAGRKANAGPAQAYVGSASDRTKCMVTAIGGATVTGDFGVVRAGRYVVMGGNITSLLANNLSYNGLAGGGSDNGRRKSIYARGGGTSIKPKEFKWNLTYASMSTEYTYPTLTVTQMDAVTNDLGQWDIDNNEAATSADDVAANPTRAIPGHICYTVNGKNATVANYEAKTN